MTVHAPRRLFIAPIVAAVILMLTLGVIAAGFAYVNPQGWLAYLDEKREIEAGLATPRTLDTVFRPAGEMRSWPALRDTFSGLGGTDFAGLDNGLLPPDADARAEHLIGLMRCPLHMPPPEAGGSLTESEQNGIRRSGTLLRLRGAAHAEDRPPFSIECAQALLQLARTVCSIAVTGGRLLTLAIELALAFESLINHLPATPAMHDAVRHALDTWPSFSDRAESAALTAADQRGTAFEGLKGGWSALQSLRAARAQSARYFHMHRRHVETTRRCEQMDWPQALHVYQTTRSWAVHGDWLHRTVRSVVARTLEEPSPPKPWAAPADITAPRVLSHHPQAGGLHGALSPDGRLAAIADGVWLHVVRTQESTTVFTLPLALVGGLAFDPNRRLLRVLTRHHLWTLDVDDGAPRSCVYLCSYDAPCLVGGGRWIALFGTDDTTIVSIDSLAPLATLSGSERRDVWLSLDARRLAIATDPGALEVWDLASGTASTFSHEGQWIGVTPDFRTGVAWEPLEVVVLVPLASENTAGPAPLEQVVGTIENVVGDWMAGPDFLWKVGADAPISVHARRLLAIDDAGLFALLWDPLSDCVKLQPLPR